jgi:hypothetical protein
VCLVLWLGCKGTKTPLCDGERHQTASQTMSFVCQSSLELVAYLILSFSLLVLLLLLYNKYIYKYIFIHI